MRLRVIVIAAVSAALLAGCTSATVSTASASTARRTTCGFLRDGKGAGSALSAKPGHGVTQGQIATMQNISDAWSVCLDLNTGKIWLERASGYCLADYAGNGIWEGCGGSNPEIWTLHPVSGGGFELRDETQGFNLTIGASGGVGSQVISTGASGLSPYHRTWLGPSAANRRMIKKTATQALGARPVGSAGQRHSR